MKKNLLVILIFATITTYGQSYIYHPFPTNNGNWVYQYYDDFHNPTGLFSGYTLNGDTSIAGVNYKKISGGQTWGDYQNGYIRESSKIIYYRPDTSSNEFVLYNFNLNVGDTIIHPYGNYCCNDTFLIQQVDTLLFSDGYHRQFWLNSADIWIEGIGGTRSLLNPINGISVSGGDQLACMSSDSYLIYSSGTSSCFVSIEEQSVTAANISIFPNPSNGSFNINIDKADIKVIRLTDLLGNIIFYLPTNNQKKININNLQSGTYILTLIDKDNKTTNKKIISSP